MGYLSPTELRPPPAMCIPPEASLPDYLNFASAPWNGALRALPTNPPLAPSRIVDSPKTEEQGEKGVSNFLII